MPAHTLAERQRKPERTDRIHQPDLTQVAHTHRTQPHVANQSFDDALTCACRPAVKQVGLNVAEQGFSKFSQPRLLKAR